MTQQVDGTTGNEKELSDDELYDLEWAEDEGPDQDSDESSSEEDTASDDSSETTSDEKASDQESAPDDEVGDGKSESPQGSESGSSAEGAEEDVWAGIPASVRQAYENAQNGLNAMKGRHKSEQERAAALEKELKTYKAQVADLTREKGQYEMEHPELFDEVRTALRSEFQSANPEAEQGNTADGPDVDEEEVIRTVTSAHPDALEIASSEDWAEFQTKLTKEQQALAESSDPLDFINLMGQYKLIKAVKESQSSEENTDGSVSDELEDAATETGGGSSSSPDNRRTRMTTEEEYDLEWEKED